MRAGTALEHEYQLVLRAIERTHAGVRLIPDAHVFELGIDRATRRRDLGEVPPVHADLMDRSIAAISRQIAEYGREKAREGLFRHFSAAHREVTMADAPEPTDVPVDRHVVGRVGEDELRLRLVEYLGVAV